MGAKHKYCCRRYWMNDIFIDNLHDNKQTNKQTTSCLSFCKKKNIENFNWFTHAEIRKYFFLQTNKWKYIDHPFDIIYIPVWQYFSSCCYPGCFISLSCFKATFFFVDNFWHLTDSHQIVSHQHLSHSNSFSIVFFLVLVLFFMFLIYITHIHTYTQNIFMTIVWP